MIAHARAQLAACETKLVRHRAALEAGASPAIVAGWIAEVETEQRRAQATLDQHTAQRRNAKQQPIMTEQQIRDLVTGLGDIVGVLNEADAGDRQQVYRNLGLSLVYHPDE
ncbi:MAG: hypothetical protein HKP61_17095 [Dactylosporangium sp.]|nr:hypothetical protein [Dactylosporangium sp.]NNJ62624.1 hypothetical protein [Dactylosporangium sp.]